MIPLENKWKHGPEDNKSASGKDYVQKGSEHEKTGERHGLAKLSSSDGVKGPEALARFIGRSESVLWMKRYIEKVALLDTSVLITGPSGVGKTLVAEIIHSLSPRTGKPFLKVNCASIPKEAFESTLFGGKKDHSNGIERGVSGKIEDAKGGTLLLKNIGDMPTGLQGRLLSFSENKELEKTGVKDPVPLDVRILATTNRNLQDLIVQGYFREDLYYRLNVVSIQVPRLRDRLEDLPDLVEHLIGRINSVPGTRVSNISSEAFGVLSSHDWPGNVRELQNVLERATILGDGCVISEHDVRMALRETFAGVGPETADQGKARTAKGKSVCLKEALNKVEKDLILEALSKTSGIQAEAAGMLGLTPKNLWKKIQKHSIKPDRLNASGKEK